MMIKFFLNKLYLKLIYFFLIFFLLNLDYLFADVISPGGYKRSVEVNEYEDIKDRKKDTERCKNTKANKYEQLENYPYSRCWNQGLLALSNLHLFAISTIENNFAYSQRFLFDH